MRADRLHSQRGETEALLGEYARTRDLGLRNRLVVLHRPLVYSIASRLIGTGGDLGLEDLVQVGCIGLIGAIERFDPDAGCRFATFASPTVAGVIRHYLRDQGWFVSIPRHLRDLRSRLPGLRTSLEMRLGRPPTVHEVAQACGVDEDRLLQAMDLDDLSRPVSLDAPAPDAAEGGSRAWNERMGETDPGLSRVENREAVRQGLDRMGEQHRTVLRYRYYEELSQAEIARRLGCSQMQVSRLERQALQQLRCHLMPGV